MFRSRSAVSLLSRLIRPPSSPLLRPAIHSTRPPLHAHLRSFLSVASKGTLPTQRGSTTVRNASSPTQNESIVPFGLPDRLTRLESSIRYELENKAVNFEGKSLRFSDYAAGEFDEISGLLPPSAADLAEFIVRLARYLRIEYPRVTVQARLEALSRAFDFVEACRAIPTDSEPAPVARPSTPSVAFVRVVDDGVSAGSPLAAPPAFFSTPSDEPSLPPPGPEDRYPDEPISVSVSTSSTTIDLGPRTLSGPQPKPIPATPEAARREAILARPSWLGNLGPVPGQPAASETPSLVTQTFGEVAQAVEARERREREILSSGTDQRTDDWHALRANRLTASAYANALGFFSGQENRRLKLWEEKLKLAPPFKGNEATNWGTNQEAAAIDDYVAITRRGIRKETFRTYGPPSVSGCPVAADLSTAHIWIGASPDGIILPASDPLDLGRAQILAPSPHPSFDPGTAPRLPSGLNANEVLPISAAPRDALQTLPTELDLKMGPGEGVLEVKCPFNKGAPESGHPWDAMPDYYMPQVQALMEVFDCDWAHLYCWTPSQGSAIFHVARDPDYWAAVWVLLAEFWYEHYVPAKLALARGVSPVEARERFGPAADSNRLAHVREWSKVLSQGAEVYRFQQQLGIRGPS